MDIGLGSYGLAFLAGILSILSPCVLPLVPILVGTAASSHRYGPLALAAGLMVSFTAAGILILSIGSSLGLDQSSLRVAGAVILLVFGFVLLSGSLQAKLAAATSGVSGAGNQLLARVSLDGLAGQFVIGLLLGIVWSPCVGPTLGAAIALASQGQQLAEVTLVMALFSLGAGIPLIVLGTLSREFMLRIRGKLMSAGKHGKQALGILLLVLGAFILLGIDKQLEGWILDHAPAWFTQIGTSL
ncbi:cytochrome c biogenesis CcdA family protein [Thiothrix subterranea]|uniref:Cytochrome c biogenesis CcdA family protein n=1 Tax=Thiothrix subterranea TaxID=2735563 RepID=A0AA51R2U1_9GAMM|nr:cytochrome c biogenesis CcdA family protein [Thiothrix subterranea]MDQ5768724.1 cytochrome c biogenesis CcdA family protein [Thiothrix subterranea]WML84875.1 cytochrome c biogenesis CcdA family protein [Thiothrix subterranea]